MGLFSSNSAHWNLGDGIPEAMHAITIAGTPFDFIFDHAMSCLDIDVAANGEGQPNDLYNEAVRIHKQVGAPAETLDVLDHLKHKEETVLDLRIPGTAAFFDYRRYWNFGLRVRRVTKVEHNRVVIEMIDDPKNWAWYHPECRGTVGEMREKKDPMGHLNISCTFYKAKFEAMRAAHGYSDDVIVEKAITHLAGTLLHEFMHAEGYDHPDSRADPEYSKSINDIFDKAMRAILDRRVAGVFLSEEEFGLFWERLPDGGK